MGRKTKGPACRCNVARWGELVKLSAPGKGRGLKAIKLFDRMVKPVIIMGFRPPS